MSTIKLPILTLVTFLSVFLLTQSEISNDNLATNDSEIGWEYNNKTLSEMEPGCPHIENLSPIKNIKTLMGTWIVPFMSPHWIHSLSKSMHGLNMNHGALSKSCIKINVKITDSNSLWIQSKCPRTKVEFNMECFPNELINSKLECSGMNFGILPKKEESSPSRVYLFESELSEDYALAIQCYPKKGINWAILSQSKVNEPKVVKNLLNKLEPMGLNIKNLVEIPYEKCY